MVPSGSCASMIAHHFKKLFADDPELPAETRRLLAHVKGLTLREMDAAEECSGFGGAFSVKFAEVCPVKIDPPKLLLDLRSEITELFSILPRPDQKTSSMVLITGPSRTANIEQILIRRVHGPGEVRVVVV